MPGSVVLSCQDAALRGCSAAPTETLPVHISSHFGVRLTFLVPFVWNSVKDTGQAEEHGRSDQSREPNSDAALLDGLNPVLPVWEGIGRNKGEIKAPCRDESLGHHTDQTATASLFVPALHPSSAAPPCRVLGSPCSTLGMLAQVSPQCSSAHEQWDHYSLCPAAWKPSVPSSPSSSDLHWARLELAQQLCLPAWPAAHTGSLVPKPNEADNCCPPAVVAPVGLIWATLLSLRPTFCVTTGVSSAWLMLSRGSSRAWGGTDSK